MTESTTSEELQQKVAENQELEKQLTKKNDQFMFDLKKLLDDGIEIDESQKIEAFNTMLKALVDGQKTGITAKQLYGTPTEAVEFITTKPATPPNTTFASMWLDNSLLLFAILSIITGTMTMLSKSSNQPTQGILALVIGSMSGGLSFYLIYRYIYIYDMPGADKSKKPGILKTGGIMALCFVPWLMIFGFTAALPQSINPTLDPVITILLGAIAVGIRYLLKKKYNIQGSLFLRP